MRVGETTSAQHTQSNSTYLGATGEAAVDLGGKANVVEGEGVVGNSAEDRPAADPAVVHHRVVKWEPQQPRDQRVARGGHHRQHAVCCKHDEPKKKRGGFVKRGK